MNGIDGGVAIVTGAGSGIGRETALRFADEGARVVVADVVEDGGHETVELIEQDGGEATFVHTDVTKQDDVEQIRGQIDRLVDQLSAEIEEQSSDLEDGDPA